MEEQGYVPSEAEQFVAGAETDEVDEFVEIIEAEFGPEAAAEVAEAIEEGELDVDEVADQLTSV